ATNSPNRFFPATQRPATSAICTRTSYYPAGTTCLRVSETLSPGAPAVAAPLPETPLFPHALFPWRSVLFHIGPCWLRRRISASNPPATLRQTVPVLWRTTESPLSSRYRLPRHRRAPPGQKVPVLWSTTESPLSSRYRLPRQRRVPPVPPQPTRPLPASPCSTSPNLRPTHSSPAARSRWLAHQFGNRNSRLPAQTSPARSTGPKNPAPCGT